MSAFGSVAVERARPRSMLVAVAVLAALVANLVVYSIGRLAGGSYRFTAPTSASADGGAGPVVNEVDALTVGGFTVVPLLAGLALAAALSRRWPWVLSLALLVAPALALVTIAVMTVPTDLDTVTTVALAACHVVLAVVSVLALLQLRRLHPHRPA